MILRMSDYFWHERFDSKRYFWGWRTLLRHTVRIWPVRKVRA